MSVVGRICEEPAVTVLAVRPIDVHLDANYLRIRDGIFPTMFYPVLIPRPYS